MVVRLTSTQQSVPINTKVCEFDYQYRPW